MGVSSRPHASVKEKSTIYTLHSLDMCGLLRQGKHITPFAILLWGLIVYPVQLWRELGQSACPQLSLQGAGANGCTSSVKAMPFTQSKSNPNHNSPAVISLRPRPPRSPGSLHPQTSFLSFLGIWS